MILFILLSVGQEGRGSIAEHCHNTSSIILPKHRSQHMRAALRAKI